jgi:hypothetical protein
MNTPYSIATYVVKRGKEVVELVACHHGEEIALETAEDERPFTDKVFPSLDDLEAYLRAEGWEIVRPHSAADLGGC